VLHFCDFCVIKREREEAEERRYKQPFFVLVYEGGEETRTRMVSDQDIAKGVESLLRHSDPNSITTVNAVVQQLEAKLGLDLSHKAPFIRDQIDLLLRSHPPHAFLPHPPPPPLHKDYFAPHPSSTSQPPTFLPILPSMTRSTSSTPTLIRCAKSSTFLKMLPLLPRLKRPK